MCKHIYTKNNRKNNQQKPCSLYYLGNNTINNQLPLDKDGFCFFHSDNQHFRKSIDFENLFFETISILQKKKTTFYDFSEIKLGHDTTIREGNRVRVVNINIHDYEFDGEIDFSNSIFYCPVVFSNISTSYPINFLNISAISIEFENNCKLNNIDFSYSIISTSLKFENSKLNGKLLFYDSNFDKKAITILSTSTFRKAVGFYNSKLYTIIIRDSKFIGKLNFEQTTINGDLDWEKINLKEDLGMLNCEINPDTDYNPSGKSPISIKNICASENVIINLKGKKPYSLFFDKVDIFFNNSDFNGVWQFQNANLNYLTSNSKTKLYNLIPSGIVNIGTGCIKFRNMLRKNIFLNSDKQNLAIELSMTFSNYFTNINGIQLGVEIEEKTPKYVRLIYFSDENISEQEFNERLAFSEKNFWSLLGNKPDEVLTEDEVININDTLVDIMGVLFKLGSRIAIKTLNIADLSSVIDTVSFHDKFLFNIENVNELIIKNYSQKSLLSINPKQIIEEA